MNNILKIALATSVLSSGLYAAYINSTKEDSAVVGSTSESEKANVHGDNQPESVSKNTVVSATGAISQRNDQSTSKLEPDSRPFLTDYDGELDSNFLDQFLSERLVAEYRVVVPDTEAIRTYIRNRNGNLTPPILLTGGYEVEIAPRSIDDHFSGWQSGTSSLIGVIDGEPDSSVTMLVAPDGSLRATIVSSKGRFRIESNGQLPYHVVWLMKPHEKKID